MKATQTIKSLVVAALFSLPACGVESPDDVRDEVPMDGQDELSVGEASDGNHGSPSLAPRMPRDPLAGDGITLSDAPARARRLTADAPTTDPTNSGSTDGARGPQGGVTVEDTIGGSGDPAIAGDDEDPRGPQGGVTVE